MCRRNHKEWDIAALGELLIDFTEAGVSGNGMLLFEQNPGGAPANLLTAAAHMGCKTTFIGKIGADMQGNFLADTLRREGIDTSNLVQSGEVFTTLAFVALDKQGERQFSFARKPGADTCLSMEEIQPQVLEQCKIFHVGSLSLTDEPAKGASLWSVKKAKSAGALISYDPNYRSSLWKDRETAVQAMREIIPFADLMKVSEEECLLLTEEKDCRKGAERLLEAGPGIVAVTLGGKGVLLAQKEKCERIPGFETFAVDTTGAGDTFWGGFLSRFVDYGKEMECMQWQDWKECAVTGNAMAALCIQKRGGIPSIPDKETVQKFILDYKCETEGFCW